MSDVDQSQEGADQQATASEDGGSQWYADMP